MGRERCPPSRYFPEHHRDSMFVVCLKLRSGVLRASGQKRKEHSPGRMRSCSILSFLQLLRGLVIDR